MAPDNGRHQYHVACEVGGTVTKMGLFSNAGSLVSSARWDTPDTPEEIVNLIVREARGVSAAHDIRVKALMGVGVSLPAAVDPSTLAIGRCDNIGNLEGFPLASVLGEELGCRIYLENDANSALRGEIRAGAAAGSRNAALVVVGTGVGAALCVDGRILSGSSGSVGEIGYMPFSHPATTLLAEGTHQLHSLLAGPALENLARSRRNSYPKTTAGADTNLRELFDLAANDPLGSAVLVHASGILASVVSMLASVADPDVIVLTGGVGSNPVLVNRCMSLCARGDRPPRRIAAGELGSLAGLYGLSDIVRSNYESARSTPSSIMEEEANDTTH
ncbi:ROK family protein [Promicromonospora sp. MS192]|uniref:ROK family protein n=1 Tax=Promicromonospora sp. MS192 TaxID=3412684 RepID=UPI003C2C5A63